MKTKTIIAITITMAITPIRIRIIRFVVVE